MASYESDPPPRASGWAVAGVVFGGTLMLLIGFFQAMIGLAAISQSEFYTVPGRYEFDLSINTWGWIHLIIGAVVAITGLLLLARKEWAKLLALCVLVASAVSQFFFIPYYPFWAILVIALDVWVIWSLTRPGALSAS
jgi:hypothetical protein